MRSASLAATAASLVIACGSAPAPEASHAAPPPTAPAATMSPAPSPPVKDDARFVVSDSGELLLPAPITFVVRPLSGPGTMGPSELAPESDRALSHVAAYVRAHPEADVRIECAVNAIKMSSGPNSARGAHLAQLVARWLVDRGISCKRLESVGVLERNSDAPAERVRIFARRSPEAAGESRADPCTNR
jgi:hypothetical protein